ncbi:Colicin V production protein [Pigmentiphaga humi]|uniref:Colicin V production protein n=1 Tax=Pigmentiphaga humi TaxID=2478468 RepID=A0A3P4B271_9BURK|nr:CvpA family protein [Pigmentiphaga humi]VCU70387.1 Colicin V production protein [Pigmentiphaga humi]
MTHFDYGVLLILGASVVIGLFRGLVKEVLSLVAYVAAFTGAIRYGPHAYDMLAPYIENSGLRAVVAYAGVFIAVLIAVGIVNLALGMVMKATGLSLADRGLGALFGLARGVLIVLVLVVAAGFTPLPKEPWWTEAVLSPYAEAGVRAVRPYLPEQFADWIRY